MKIPYSEWRKPTDARYAFALRAVEPVIPPVGSRRDIREVLREGFTAEAAVQFEERVSRWTGPENTIGSERPYEGRQLQFREAPWVEGFTRGDAEAWLRGEVWVLRSPEGQTDYVMRDHHTVDVALYHWVTTGTHPSGLFHADRHSDWCKDSYLNARTPDQAATWWALLAGLKLPGTGAPWLAEEAVHFTTAQAPTAKAGTRDIGAHELVPYWVTPDALDWESALNRGGALDCDWLSVDLDYFQPARQFALTRGLLVDARFRGLLHHARVRLFVLSPQFIQGGDRMERWEARGSVASSVRILNVLRRGSP